MLFFKLVSLILDLKPLIFFHLFFIIIIFVLFILFVYLLLFLLKQIVGMTGSRQQKLVAIK